MIHFFWGAWIKSGKMAKAKKKSKPGEISAALAFTLSPWRGEEGKRRSQSTKDGSTVSWASGGGENGGNPWLPIPWYPIKWGWFIKGPPSSKIPPFSLWIVAWFLSWNLWRFLHLWLLTHIFFQWNVDQGTSGRLPATNSYLSSLGKWTS